MTGNAENSTVYSFDGFRLEVAKRLLYGADGKTVALKAKAFETLLFLVENSGRVVERDELLGAVWPDTIVEENNLTQHISSLRRVFGEKPDDHRFIATVAGRGYMFVAKVERDKKTPGSEAAPDPKPSLVRGLVILAILTISLLFIVGFLYRDTPQPAAASTIKSIAVLPFKSIVEQDRDPAFEVGITRDLIIKLNGADGLEVRPYSAVKDYDLLDQEPVDVGQALNVDAVLAATVQRSSRKVQLSVTLTRTGDGKLLWAEAFNKALTEEFFDVQEQLSDRVASELKIKLSPNAQKRMTDNFDAYTYYLSGREHQLKLIPPEINLAIGDYRKAIELDPNYALAYAGIADSYRGLVLSGELPLTDIVGKSMEAAEKAVTLDPQLAEAQTSVGFNNFWFKRDWAASEEALKRALQIDPKSAMAHHHYAHLLSNIGRHDEAIAEAEKVRSLAGYDPFLATIQGMVYEHAGQIETALSRFKLASDLDERLWLPNMFAAIAYLDQGQHDQEALNSARKASELNPSQSISPAYEVVALARLGQHDEAKRILNELLRRAEVRYVPPYHIAIAYMGIGDHESALQMLEKSFNEQDFKIVFLKVDNIWDPLRSEARFRVLMQKMNLSEEK